MTTSPRFLILAGALALVPTLAHADKKKKPAPTPPATFWVGWFDNGNVRPDKPDDVMPGMVKLVADDKHPAPTGEVVVVNPFATLDAPQTGTMGMSTGHKPAPAVPATFHQYDDYDWEPTTVVVLPPGTTPTSIAKLPKATARTLEKLTRKTGGIEEIVLRGVDVDGDKLADIVISQSCFGNGADGVCAMFGERVFARVGTGWERRVAPHDTW